VLGVTRELAQFDPERIRVTVVGRRRPYQIDRISFQQSFSPRIPKLPNAVFALQRPLTIRHYDVVHYMDSRPPLDFFLGRQLNVITQHGFASLMFGDDYVVRRERYLNKILLRLAPYADLTFTASESERHELLNRTTMDPARVVVIHHGVDHDRFCVSPDSDAARDDIRSRFGIEGRFVLCVSNFQRKKNTERLVEAFGQLARTHRDVQLVLAGWHTARFQLVRDLIRDLGLERSVRVLGHVPDDVLPALYTSADVFALPSLHEGFGLPVLEAMACGTPVLASNVYALPEVCGDAAVLVDPYSVDAIAEGLLGILEDTERAAELRDRGLERASQFTWRRSAERHLEAYERLLR
jgi:glycosyltransferase involved in cell wall biosynthesis